MCLGGTRTGRSVSAHGVLATLFHTPADVVPHVDRIPPGLFEALSVREVLGGFSSADNVQAVMSASTSV